MSLTRYSDEGITTSALDDKMAVDDEGGQQQVAEVETTKSVFFHFPETILTLQRHVINTSDDKTRADLLRSFQKPASLSTLAIKALASSNIERESLEDDDEEVWATLHTAPLSKGFMSARKLLNSPLPEPMRSQAPVNPKHAKQNTVANLRKSQAPAVYDSPDHLARNDPDDGSSQRGKKRRRATSVSNIQMKTILNSIEDNTSSGPTPIPKKKKQVTFKATPLLQSPQQTAYTKNRTARKSAPSAPPSIQTHKTPAVVANKDADGDVSTTLLATEPAEEPRNSASPSRQSISSRPQYRRRW